MTGLPTTQILVDDGTGTFPTDITTKTRLPEGFTWTRGRGDELSAGQPGTGSLTWDNADNSLTPFGAGGLSCDQAIRIKVNGNNRWTGRLSSIPVAWPDGDDTFAIIAAAATDASSALSRVQLSSAADMESMIDPGLVAYYPMQEDSSQRRAHDVSGNLAPSLRITAGLGGSSAFGVTLADPRLPSTIGLADAGTGWQQVGVDAPTLQSTPTFAAQSAIRVTFAVERLTGLIGTYLLLSLDRDASGFGFRCKITYDAPTQILTCWNFSTSFSATVNLNDGNAHVLTWQADASGHALWVDGAKVATNGTAFFPTFDESVLLIGDSTGVATVANDQQTFARVSLGSSTISDARVEQLHAAILNDFLGETPAARMTRLLTYTPGVSAGSLDTAGDTLLGLASQAGRNVNDVVSDAATADLGQAFIDKNGALSYVSGATMAGKTPVSLDAGWFSEDTQVIVDMYGVVNSATGKSSYTQNTVSAEDSGSIDDHGLYPNDYTWDVSTDDQAQDRTDWMVNSYSEPAARVGSLKLDMLSLDATNLAHALTLDIGSWLEVTGLPSQTPGGTTADFVVEQITETVTQTEWSLTLNVASRARVGAWILGDSVWGVLGTTTKLFV